MFRVPSASNSVSVLVAVARARRGMGATLPNSLGSACSRVHRVRGSGTGRGSCPRGLARNRGRRIRRPIGTGARRGRAATTATSAAALGVGSGGGGAGGSRGGAASAPGLRAAASAAAVRGLWRRRLARLGDGEGWVPRMASGTAAATGPSPDGRGDRERRDDAARDPASAPGSSGDGPRRLRSSPPKSGPHELAVRVERVVVEVASRRVLRPADGPRARASPGRSSRCRPSSSFSNRADPTSRPGLASPQTPSGPPTAVFGTVSGRNSSATPCLVRGRAGSRSTDPPCALQGPGPRRTG